MSILNDKTGASTNDAPIMESTDRIFFDVREIVMRRFDGSDEINLEPLWTNITVRESVLSPFMTATVSIVDAVGLFQDYFRGEEQIDISFQTKNSDNIIKLKMYVNNIPKIDIGKRHSNISYNLVCVSREAFFSPASIIGYYSEKLVSEMAQDIFNNKLAPISNKTISVSKTTGPQQLIVPAKDILGAMKFLAKRSYSSNFPSSMFSFFETNRKFYFYNLEQLIQEKKNKKVNKVYQYNSDVKVDTEKTQVSESSFFNVLDFQIGKISDSLNTLESGSAYASVTDFDIITKNITTTEFKSTPNSTEHVDDKSTPIHSNEFIKKFTKEPLIDIYKTIDSSRKKDFISEIIGPRIFNIIGLNDISASAEIYGNTDLEAGDIIEIIVPNPVGETVDGRDPNSYKLSGNWFVTEIVHNLTPQNYKQNLILSKDSFQGSNIK